MAQVVGGTTFDFMAWHKHAAAQRILSRAADLWVAGGREALNLDSLIAVLLRIFLSRGLGMRMEGRTLEAWLNRVKTAENEANSLLSSTNPATVAEVLALLRADLSFASEQWMLGDPEQPPDRGRLELRGAHSVHPQISRRPASPKLPTMVRVPRSNCRGFFRPPGVSDRVPRHKLQSLRKPLMRPRSWRASCDRV